MTLKISRLLALTTTLTWASHLTLNSRNYIQQGPPAITGIALPTRGRRKDDSRDRCRQKRMGLPERQLSKSLQLCLMGLPKIPESPHEQQNRGVAEASFRDGAAVSSIDSNCRGETSSGIAASSSIVEGCWVIASGVAGHLPFLGLQEHMF